MAKIRALYINELYKISKMMTVYAILLVMLAGMLVTGGIFKYSQNRQQTLERQSNTESFAQAGKPILENRVTLAQSKLAQIRNEIATAPADQKTKLEWDAANLGYQIDSLKTAIRMEVFIFSEYYMAQAIQAVVDYKTEAALLQTLPAGSLTQAQQDQVSLLADLIPRMEEAVANRDFSAYTAVINQKLRANPELSQTEKDIELERNQLRLTYNVTNEDKNKTHHSFIATSTLGITQTSPPSQEDMINKIVDARRSLAYNLDFSANPNSPVPLTPERRGKLANDIVLYISQLDTGFIQAGHFSFMRDVTGVGVFIMELLLLVLASGTISQELSTGSIKSLVISPAKRWKIYVAKLLSLLTVGAVAAILCYIAGILSFVLFYGTGAASPYLYVASGEAFMMNFYLFAFFKLLIGLIPVVFYLILAMMLSTLTRNTAVSVGSSIGVLFGSTLAFPIVTQLLKGEWLKFLPFSNFDFAAKMFLFDPSASTSSGINTTIAFSALYMLCLVSIMFYTGLDSFTRRDIK